MKALFWLSACLVTITYVLYPVCVYLQARLRPRPVRKGNNSPSVSIVLAVHNGERDLAAKLSNLATLDYPADLLQTVIVSDGSTDQTNLMLANWQNSRREAVFLPKHAGKAVALNHGIAQAKAEIICFTDVRQEIASDGLRNLVANFSDPSVGCVSGELMLRQDSDTACSDGVGLYWRLEKNIRRWEALCGSTVGATGAFYAVRKDLVPVLPEVLILDDLYVPIEIARQGSRVVFEAKAVAWDNLSPGPRQEFRRKVRTLNGSYQLLKMAPWILTRANPLRGRFIVHKMFRLLVPFALLGLAVSTCWLRQGIYELVLVSQLVGYSLALLALLRWRLGFVSRPAKIALAFVLFNTAAAVALGYFLADRKVTWARSTT